MKNESAPSQKNIHETIKGSKYFTLTLIMVISCVAVPVSLILLEIIPTYITFPISPPTDSYGEDWRNTTKSVIIFDSTFRVFIWRKEAILSYDNMKDIPSWDSIKAHFDDSFSKYGWAENDSSASCNTFLPESAFLQPGRNGFVSYRKTDNSGIEEEPSANDVICLAIWNDEGYPDVYRIVVLTAKSSLFTRLLTVFEL